MTTGILYIILPDRMHEAVMKQEIMNVKCQACPNVFIFLFPSKIVAWIYELASLVICKL